MRRSAGMLLLAAALAGTFPAYGQTAFSEEDWLAPKAPDAAAVEHELATLFRLLRHGSGKDRLDVRARMAALGRDAVSGLIARLDDGNALVSRSAALVLGELRDPRAGPGLIRTGGEAGKGDPVGALFAVGRLRSPEAIPTLTVQAVSARSNAARVAAALALGRCAAPESVPRLAELASGAKLDADVVAFATALGLTGDPAAVETLRTLSENRSDRVRRAATCALAALNASSAESALLARLADEDPETRIAALEGLATITSATIAADKRVLLRSTSSDAEERAAAVFVVVGGGGRDADLAAARFARDPSERVRAATAAAAAARPGPAIDALIATLAVDGHDLPRLAAVIATAVRAGRTGNFDRPEFGCDDRAAEVRDAALVATAWLRGGDARVTLQRVVAARREDRGVDRAKALLRVLEQPPALAHRILRAELQVILDDAGLAASWRPLSRLNRWVIVAADVHDVLPEEQARPTVPGPSTGTGGVGGGSPGGGGGGPPGGGAGPDRSRSKRRAPPPEAEDLRRHLERHPYPDRREVLEIPLIR